MLRSLLLLPLIACGGPEATPLEGPGWNTETNTLTASQDTPFLVGLTYLRVINAPGPGGRFGDLAQAAGSSLYEDEPPGFVAASFRNDGQLDQWTMTIWENEESMTAWAFTNEKHTRAMSQFWDVAARGKTTVVQRSAAELPITWEEALQLIDATEWYAGVK